MTEPTAEERPFAQELRPVAPVPGSDAADATAAELEEHHVSFLRWLAELLILVAVSFVLAMGIRTYVVQPFYIPTGSMDPTLQVGDRVLVNKFIYRLTDPVPGDVVVFEAPADDEVDLIKRVIAVGGQTIDIADGVVSIDGVEIAEEYLPRTGRDSSSLMEPMTVPEGQVFVMGDNRANSQDSRFFGTQPVDHILGRAFAVYWPVASIGSL